MARQYSEKKYEEKPEKKYSEQKLTKEQQNTINQEKEEMGRIMEKYPLPQEELAVQQYKTIAKHLLRAAEHGDLEAAELALKYHLTVQRLEGESIVGKLMAIRKAAIESGNYSKTDIKRYEDLLVQATGGERDELSEERKKKQKAGKLEEKVEGTGSAAAAIIGLTIGAFILVSGITGNAIGIDAAGRQVSLDMITVTILGVMALLIGILGARSWLRIRKSR